MQKMNSVVHFEMPAKNKKRASEFYTKVFGWQMQQFGEDFGHYLMAMTTESDEKGPKNPGAINGGFYDYKNEEGFKEPSIVISVEDLDAHIEEVKKAGGRILGEPMEIPGVGRFVSMYDTEDNRVGLLQPAR